MSPGELSTKLDKIIAEGSTSNVSVENIFDSNVYCMM
jgi:hypothetical protein